MFDSWLLEHAVVESFFEMQNKTIHKSDFTHSLDLSLVVKQQQKLICA